VPTPLLLAVPNVSEGRDPVVIEEIAAAFAGQGDGGSSARRGPSQHSPEGVRVLDTHSDPDHNRSVYTLAGPQAQIADAVMSGARAAVARIDVLARPDDGQHPRVGALDVAPIVYLNRDSRGAAFAEALVLADRIAFELEIPVFLYGELAGGRTRAELRRGGVRALAARLARGAGAGGTRESKDGQLRPDFGPPRLHPSAGATLVAAREPLVAFNLVLSPPAGVADARRVASLIREGGEHGLPGVRAIGVELSGARAQVSINVERPFDVPLAQVLTAVSRHAPVASAEIVGLVPSAALEGFPADTPLLGFDPDRCVLEKALRS
jgi:glutamate formiminotransferase